MTRPQIIRADTIDLQGHEAPSAKDHSRQPTNPAPLGEGPPAPHQAIAMKNAGLEEGIHHHTRSPRASQDLSGKELQLLHDIDGHDGIGGDHLGITGLQVNGDGAELHDEEGEVGDQEGDDSLDDDMDKISSSPSIDSGGYQLPWFNKNTSLFSTPTSKKQKSGYADASEALSSSPFLSTPDHFPLSLFEPKQDTPTPEDHHQGEYREDGSRRIPREDSHSSEARDHLMPLISESAMNSFRDEFNPLDTTYDLDFDGADLRHLLLPIDDPLLDNSFDDGTTITPISPAGSGNSWEDDYHDPEHGYAEEDDDTKDISFSDSRFVDSGWGGECLREIEDISFEFVYALHTFVATVEGQANATKGDTMVLLDDSNSYWWLVRVVKDSSIGYLPAEHIETPTERLARLNKHRNIDLSQTMLGDNPEKSKNPLKKAMRRRNAKTVQFAAPTYYEPSDNEYSSDEEGEEGGFPELLDAGGLALQGQETQTSQEEAVATVEPLHIRGLQMEAFGDVDEIQTLTQTEHGEVEQDSQMIKSRTSEDTSLGSDDSISGKSRKGTVRNTDSFFKDDTGETRKITITPGLLRDDSSSSTLITSEPRDPKTRASLDVLEKAALAPSEKPKDSKDDKRKEKKHGMLSGLFKRKDRKSKSQSQSEDEDPEWLSKETSRQSPQPKVSTDSTGQDAPTGQVSPASRSSGSRSPQRQGSKLQKSQPIKTSPATKRSPSREGQLSPTKFTSVEQPTAVLAPADVSPNALTQVAEPEDDSKDKVHPPSNSVAASSQSTTPGPEHQFDPTPISAIDSKPRGGMFTPIREALRPSPSISESKPEKTIRAKQRMPMDDFDSSPETEEAPSNPLQQLEAQSQQPRLPEHHKETSLRLNSVKERLSESPVQISPILSVNPPATAGDSSSQEEPSMSMSTSSTPELVEVPQEDGMREEGATPTSTIQSSRNAPTWSDANLRTYLEDDTDIRDLLVIVHDKSDVKPVGPDHPVVQNLCKEENRQLGEMSNRLDNLLQDFLARRSNGATR